MSNAVSALNGRTANGAITVREEGLQGMITLRGTFEDENFGAALAHIAGVDLPDVRQIVEGEDRAIAWMSPDELLLLVPYAQAAELAAKLAEALAGTHALVANVSDARALITVSGAGAIEVVGKLAPVDLHADAFGPGMIRRTRLGQVAGAFWLRGQDTVSVICFRSVADYVFESLRAGAIAGPVGAY